MTDHVCRRGDTWKRTATITTGEDSTIVGSLLWFTIKKHHSDADPGLLQLRSDGDDPGIVIVDATHAAVTITASRSALLPVGTWWFDLQIKTPSGEIHTADDGPFVVRADITRSTT